MNNYLGTIIKSIRINKGITQKDLAQGICTIRQLTRIESNESSPSAFILQGFSTRIGDDLLKYLPYSSEKDGHIIKIVLDDAYRYYNKHQYFKALSEIEKLDYIDHINDTAIQQEVLWLKSSAQIHTYQFDGNSDYFVSLLRLTKSLERVDDVFSDSLSKIELEIVSTIIYFLLEQDDLVYAQKLMYRLINYYEADHEIRHFAPYLRALYNLSKISFMNHEYGKAVDYAEKGIACCTRNSCLSQLDRLYNIGGRAYYKAGDVERGQHYLILYILLSQNRVDHYQLKTIYTTLIENYQLDLFSIENYV